MNCRVVSRHHRGIPVRLLKLSPCRAKIMSLVAITAQTDAKSKLNDTQTESAPRKSRHGLQMKPVLAILVSFVDQGCLPFVRINQLGCLLNNDKDFPKISRTNRKRWRSICNSISRYCFRLRENEKWKIWQIVRNFSPIRSEQI